MRAETSRLRERFPVDMPRLMPTRLGNVLRRFEDQAGAAYELPAVTVIPHLALVAPPEHVAYLEEQRIQLDAAIRLALVALVAAAFSFVFLWSDGLWLLVALGCYGFAYAAYRGTVVTAREYGVALTVIMDLNRFALYERLHVPLPADLDAEKVANRRIAAMLQRDRAHVWYEHPTTPPPSDATPPPAYPPPPPGS